MTFQLTPQEQLNELRKGAVDLISEEEFLKKLSDAYAQKKALESEVWF